MSALVWHFVLSFVGDIGGSMSRKSRSPAWPFLSILACLFVLSITAPRAWERIAHTKLAQPGTHCQQHDDTSVASGGCLDVSPPMEPQATRLTTSEPAQEQPPFVNSQPPIAAVPIPAVVQSAPSARVIEMPAAVAAPTPVAVAPAFGNRVVEDPLLLAVRLLPEKLFVDEVLVPPPALQSVERESADQIWTMPSTLLDQLTDLSKVAACRTWAEDVRGQIQSLSETPLPAAADSRTSALEELAALVGTGRQLAGKLEDPAQQTQFLRAHYALERRLAIWRQIIKPTEAGPAEASTTPTSTSAQRVSAKIKELETLMASSEAGNGWREYLQLDRLNEVARDPNHDTVERRRLARQILDRLARARASRQQRNFVADGPLATLGTELQSWMPSPSAHNACSLGWKPTSGPAFRAMPNSSLSTAVGWVGRTIVRTGKWPARSTNIIATRICGLRSRALW